ncbi:nucleotidyltransferase family protein [Mycobacterium sp. shizuoka-1]|uniref:nucleotidyltransferase family protein n=1 Tax=Mycobacterium sp. shizuoka-1 TaxID=2039281 RepID=UPI000C063B76|nr:nucleotidyltransferase family protein [Mycobacterium sp. shizuoka-1]GAY17382.1 hypothetical protein MSZK_41080 [Mycobacterium sp. shizuoka-1]
MNGVVARLAALDWPTIPDVNLPFPTPAQLDLAKAALLPADVAAPAWQRWKGRGLTLETVDDASARLFSRLWANRESAGIDDEDLALLKGVYRQTLAHNAVALSAGLELTQSLVDAGIPVVFIKGAAMIAMAAGQLGLRRINDVDVLIPEADAVRAMALFRAAGCQVKWEADETFIGTQHACTFRDANEAEIDVHWWAYKLAGDDQPVFDTAQPATLLGRDVLVPSATECLIGAVAGAFIGPSGSPLRWIADAVFLLENSAIEWDYLLERAGRPGLTTGLTAGLTFLASEFDAAVPRRVIDELRRRPVGWRERGAHWAACEGRRPGRKLLFQLEQHRARRARYTADVPRDFLGHIAQVTGARTGRRRDVLRRVWVKATDPE